MIYLMAWRNIWRNKIRSIIIMLSVVIGLFAGISVLALYNGMMKSRIRTVIEAEVGHLQIHHPEFKKDYEPVFVLKNGDEILKSIRLIPEIKYAAPRSVTQGMLSTATGSSGIQINGIIPELEYRTSQLQKKIIEGTGFSGNKKNEILIGKKLAVKMKLRTGSKLVLTFTDTSGNIVSGAFRVTGIYQSDNAPLDEKNAYVRMSDLNILLGTGNSFHEIALLLNKDKDLEKVQNRLKQKFPETLIESWKEISPETQLLVNTVDQYSYMIMFIIMLALAFGIVNTMLMAIIERTKEVGMMVALGMNRLRVFLLVLMETMFLTLAGTPFGLFLGWIVINYYNKNGLDFSGSGKEMMSSFGFGTMIYPEFPAERVFGVMMIVTGTALIACIFPAVKALRLQPVEALRR
ncbi:MAG: ABC transporter permease [Chitinophagaceae bacterium]|nr:MAG: ABC transporter permease [Chitinophagaceae bacterium]